MWGFLTCLNDIIIPHLKAVFELNYAKAMLIQFAFFTAYFVVSLPSGTIVTRLGYKNGIIIGLGDGGRRLPAVLSGGRRALVRPVPAGAVRAGLGHHAAAGGGEPVRRRAGQAGDRLVAADADPGVQLAGHDHRAAVRVAADPVDRRQVAGGDRRR